MSTGDGVLALLAAKAVCCGALVLAATGALGGALTWFLDRWIGWIVGGALVIGIALVIWRSGGSKSRPMETTSAKTAETPKTGAPARLGR